MVAVRWCEAEVRAFEWTNTLSNLVFAITIVAGVDVLLLLVVVLLLVLVLLLLPLPLLLLLLLLLLARR